MIRFGYRDLSRFGFVGDTEQLRHRSAPAASGCANGLGAADRYLAILAGTCGEWAAAESWYRSAVDLETAAGLPILAARTRYCHARTLLQRGQTGDRDRAADLVREATASLAETEMAGFGPCLMALPC